jgi:predicted RNase H-like HicB family nuclease/predicted RNA binding protein YcfA (HicA-like mRNA interferase family)
MKVREAIRLIEADGWMLVTMRGSHRQYKYSRKPGRVTIAGHPSDDLAPGTREHTEAGRAEGEPLMRYAIVIEKAAGNYSAYVPDLPGCVATGADVAALEENMRDAIRFHIDGLKEDGLPVPEPLAIADYVDA